MLRTIVVRPCMLFGLLETTMLAPQSVSRYRTAALNRAGVSKSTSPDLPSSPKLGRLRAGVI